MKYQLRRLSVREKAEMKAVQYKIGNITTAEEAKAVDDSIDPRLKMHLQSVYVAAHIVKGPTVEDVKAIYPEATKWDDLTLEQKTEVIYSMDSTEYDKILLELVRLVEVKKN